MPGLWRLAVPAEPESEIASAVDDGLGRLDAGERVIVTRLTGTYAGAFAAIEDDLDVLLRQIERAVANGEEVNPDWLRREARYRLLLQNIQDAYDAAARRAAPLVGEAQGLGAARGFRTGDRLLDVVFGDERPLGVGFASGTVPVDAVERFVTATEPGSPLRDVFARYGANAQETIERGIANGIVSGASPRKIAAELYARLGGQASRSQMLNLTRTETMHAFRGAELDAYARMGRNVVSRVRWTAALDARTCLFCLSMHGRTWDIDDTPETFHNSDRCNLSPVPSTQYASLQSFFQSGEDWFARQPVATQRAMIGNDQALDAYRAGQLRLSDFAGERGNPVWGASGYQRSGRAALVNAGIPIQP